jgi:hypothetical protein
MTPSELLDLAWSYPLFEALYGRRSRRFGLGFEMPEGPFRYKSAHTAGDRHLREAHFGRCRGEAVAQHVHRYAGQLVSNCINSR